MDLYTSGLDDNSQAFASDDESAQRMNAMQRMFQRIGVLKPQTSTPGLQARYSALADLLRNGA